MPLKTSDIRRRLRQAVSDGVVRFTEHALSRMRSRDFTVLDVERVLKSGFHDQGRDTVQSSGVWRYRIEGKTIDGDSIKVAVEIEDEVVVVTVID